MIVLDKNQTLTPPEGYSLISVEAEGAYLRVVYERLVEEVDNCRKWSVVTVYLNDQGREVVRTEDERFFVLPFLMPVGIAPEPSPDTIIDLCIMWVRKAVRFLRRKL